MTRLTLAWRKLDRERRLAAFAALGLFISMFLPWYQQNAVVDQLKAAPLQSRNLDAFQVFSFVEAAVLLVALALLYLLFARAEGRRFNMPGGDGTVVLAAGGWTALLLIIRLFDKPGISTHGIAGNVGVQWGIFFALAAAGAVTYAGSRIRAAAHQQPTRRARRDETVPAEPRRAAGTTVPTRAPAPQAPPGQQRSPSEDLTTVVSSPPGTTAASRARPRFPPTPSDQLSFEDPSEHPS
jgi:hypothetical protein